MWVRVNFFFTRRNINLLQAPNTALDLSSVVFSHLISTATRVKGNKAFYTWSSCIDGHPGISSVSRSSRPWWITALYACHEIVLQKKIAQHLSSQVSIVKLITGQLIEYQSQTEILEAAVLVFFCLFVPKMFNFLSSRLRKPSLCEPSL